MEPSTIGIALKALGKAFSIGLGAYKARQSWGLNADEVSALIAVFNNSSDLVAMLPTGGSKASVHLFARHAAIATSAFAAAIEEHWAGNKQMAPGFTKEVWWRRPLRSDLQAQRENDIQSRLQRAIDHVGKPERTGVARTLDFVSALIDDPLASPWYQALWEAFTNPNLEADAQPQLLELRDPGARLPFEHAYRGEYSAALASPVGIEVGSITLGLQSSQPARLREMLLRGISTWDRQHIFGAIETPGMPNLPLEDIYVEPDGIHEESKRRAPIRTLIHDELKTNEIVIIRGDFGHGKSLTARTMACVWAKAYVTDRTTSSVDLIVPVFVKCGEDFANHRPSLEDVVARAFRNQAKNLGLDVAIDDRMVALPPQTQKVVYVVDGLDEVALTSAEVEEFFQNLKDRTGGQHKAIVFSRKGVIPEREKRRGIPVVDVQPFRTKGERPGGQVAEWLEKWNRASGQAPISIEQLEEKKLLGIVTTPIVLFMAVMTWNAQDNAGAPLEKAEIYERFFLQIAAGKCQQDQDRHLPVFEASGKLLERLRDQGEIERAKPPIDESAARALAMLWLMGRVAWEGQRRAKQGDDLTLHDVTNILREELKIKRDPHAEEMIKVGVLLVLQADRQGGNDRILFGHKSFREFLVARFWAGQLRRIVRAGNGERTAIEKNLLGARLLGRNDKTFEFLLQILNSPAWDDDRANLIEWARDCFNNEEPDSAAESWLEDRRPMLREAALAIGSSVKGAKGIAAKRPTTLRTMLAWFWLTQEHCILVAPGLSMADAKMHGAILRGANLAGANLRGVNLEEADLTDANLDGADLDGAFLADANLAHANLAGANLSGAIFARANLNYADLTDVILNCAILKGASLKRAQLACANLADANLEGANLTGASLTGANLAGADLDNVLHDGTTIWPDGVVIQDGKVIVPSAHGPHNLANPPELLL